MEKGYITLDRMFKKLVHKRDILLKLDEKTFVSDSGIYMVYNESVVFDRMTTGTVVMTGSKPKYVSVGDKVKFSIEHGIDLKINGEMYTLISEEKIIGIYTAD